MVAWAADSPRSGVAVCNCADSSIRDERTDTGSSATSTWMRWRQKASVSRYLIGAEVTNSRVAAYKRCQAVIIMGGLNPSSRGHHQPAEDTHRMLRLAELAGGPLALGSFTEWRKTVGYQAPATFIYPVTSACKSGLSILRQTSTLPIREIIKYTYIDIYRGLTWVSKIRGKKP